MASRHDVMVALRDHTAAVCVQLAVNAQANLIEATPFDTGWARANWIPSLGSPVVTVAGGPATVDPGPQEAGAVAVLAFKLEDGAIFISNNVPYIGRLDAGSSTQAPSGFVRKAIASAILDAGNGRLA